MLTHPRFPPHLRRFRPLGRLLALAAALGLAACGDGDDGQSPPPDQGQPVAAGCQDGTVAATGALYRACFPADWNGDLIVYAHGYVRADEPLAVPSDEVGGLSVSQIVNAMGYAYAASSYRANGLVADLAADDVADLVQEVRSRYRPDPTRAFVVGVSEGGLVATLAAERHADLFAGGVDACGPTGDFAAQIDYLGDFRVLFDYFFPGVIPGGPVDVPAEVRAQWDATYVPAVLAALQADIPATAQLLSVAGAPVDPGDLTTAGATVVSALWYDVFALPDARARLGGQPYDNIGRRYHGSLDDDALNAGVARVTADADARAALGPFETTGSLTIPFGVIHTTGDPVVPVSQAEEYIAKVAAAGASSRLTSQTVQRYGHCAFEQSELLGVFSAVVQQATGAAAARLD
jgi:pimeloyl-ACP methyl ester carboxylesterase